MPKARYIPIIFLSFLSFLQAREGINYSQIVTSNASYCNFVYQTVHIIEVDPNLYEIKAVKASDNGIGRESVLSIAERKMAIAAINGGFFTIGGTFDGNASGALKINDWYSLPVKPRGCIGWSSQNNSCSFDRLFVSIECTYGDNSFFIDGLNRSRKCNETVLFTPVFNRTTLTCSDGEEVIIRNGMIVDIINHLGSSTIPTDGAVLSIQKSHPLYGAFKVGAPISFRLDPRPQTNLTRIEEWAQYDYIVGGAPLLIHNEQITDFTDFTPELAIPSFITSRHARTAVGILPNGNWLFVVVDKTGKLDGMTIIELANLMKSFGCIYALNLDGCDSSTMVYENEIKNSPHGDKDEGLGKKTLRRVSDAIIVVPK